ncbi:MAG TPA: hypothetical protein VGM91_01730 [Conexibacter sp.]
MAPDPWLAIDVATPPAERARELRRAWEAYLEGGPIERVRTPIASSWQRSHAAGVDPLGARLAPLTTDTDAASDRWRSHPLAAAAPLIKSLLAPVAEQAEQLIVVSDADGTLMWVGGHAAVRRDAAVSMNFTEGAAWSEEGAGTNAIGTAIAAGHALQVFAAEHFNAAVQPWTCAAAPIRDPDSGLLLGVIDLTGRVPTVHPLSLGVAIATADAVEGHLRSTMNERDGRLRARYEERVLRRGGKRALVTPSGRVIGGDGVIVGTGERLQVPAGGGELLLPSGAEAFAEPLGHEAAYSVRALEPAREGRRRSLLKLALLGREKAVVELGGRLIVVGRRQTEILALLSSRPAGMTGDELAADLYGDAGQPGSARVQVFRLRKVLGPWITTDPYRLAADVVSDVARVRGLLDRGDVRLAAESYAGPLLPHSEAPGVERERDQLDRWLRQAVLASDDHDALWAWVQTPTGEDDLTAWKRLLSEIDYCDPRRSLAAARLASLRAGMV